MEAPPSSAEVCRLPDFILVKGGQTYAASTQEEAATIVSSYERATIAKFVVEHQSTKFGTEDWHGKKLFRWSLKGVPSSFGPAIVIGTKVLCCHQGKDRHINFKRLKREQTRLKRMAKDQGSKDRDSSIRKATKKVNCPAAISIKKVAFFPDYQVTEATPHRKRMSCKRFNQDRLKRPETIKTDIKFFVTLPDCREHKNHLSGDDLFKKIMTNRSLYDPQCSMTERKRKKKAKKQRKRERRGKVPKTDERFEAISFPFLPDNQTMDPASGLSLGGCGISDSRQLASGGGAGHRVDVEGQTTAIAARRGVEMIAAEQTLHDGGQDFSMAGQSCNVVRHVASVVEHGMNIASGDLSITGQNFTAFGQEVGVAGRNPIVIQQGMCTPQPDREVDIGRQESTLAEQNLTVLDAIVAAQNPSLGDGEDTTGQAMNVGPHSVPNTRHNLSIAGQGFAVAGCNSDSVQQTDVGEQELIEVDRRQLLPMDHL